MPHKISAPARRKLSFPLVLEALARYRDEATGWESLDRRDVLARLQREFDASAEELALRGFDRAYRLIVEGV